MMMGLLHSKLMAHFGRNLLWVLPGLSFKRWIGGGVIGVIVLLLGVGLLLNLQPFTWLIRSIEYWGKLIPNPLSGLICLLLGLSMVIPSYRKLRHLFFEGTQTEGRAFIEALYRQKTLSQGPKIVAIGGGTGLSTLLRGLKHYTSNLTAVVTVGDDGGSSGVLRAEHGIIPPGDIRNCIAALADEEQLITELFQYRFNMGDGLSGHSFGNLFLTALCHIKQGDMLQAIRESCKVLNVRGKVLPATLEQLKLVATFTDGSQVIGESQIPEAKKPIQTLALSPQAPKGLEEAVLAIAQADLIILGPGSLFTSVLPNLLIPDIAHAFIASDAKKVYACNIVTQPGETDHLDAWGHVAVLANHLSEAHPTFKTHGWIDAIVTHPTLSQEALPEKYTQAGATPVALDVKRFQQHGIACKIAHLMPESTGALTHIRHDSRKLAEAILSWYERATAL
jgi:uncharacterized cofD-like protein